MANLQSFKQVLCIILMLMLSACNNAKKELTIADLNSNPIEFHQATGVSPQRRRAIDHYQAYLQKTEYKTHYAEALRRVADLELEISEESETREDDAVSNEIMLSSIEHYNTYLATYPGHEKNDLILYQLAKAYSLTGDIEKALKMMDEIVANYANSRHIDEVQFRRGEILFVWREFEQAEKAYSDIVVNHKLSAFYEKSLYKLGWSQFKQSHYMQSLSTYLSLLDIKQQESKIDQYGLTELASKSEKDFILDSLRVVSLSLSYLNGYHTIQRLFQGHQKKFYEPLIYKQLAELYSKKQRFADAAKTYMAFTDNYSKNHRGPEFHSLALQAYIDGGLDGEVLPAKISYVKRYGVKSFFWSRQSLQNKKSIKPELIKHIKDIAFHYHAQARIFKKLGGYKTAAYWYKKFLESFPKNTDAAYMNFLLAESLYDAKNYSAALQEYEKTAYNYSRHKYSAEAAYAALLTYNKLLVSLTKEGKAKLKKLSLESAIRFSNGFAEDKHAPAVITRTAERLFEIKEYSRASEFSKRIIDHKTLKNKALLLTARIVYAHSQFELKDYSKAEVAYKSAIIYVPLKGKKNKNLKSDLTEKMAASIYMQAETFKNKSELQLAAHHYLRLGKTIPGSAIHIIADYDAATIFVQSKQWQSAINTLLRFRKKFSMTKKENKQYAQGVASKLVVSYSQTAQFSKAAREIKLLSSMAKTAQERRSLLWEAAEMYDKAGREDLAVTQYIKYIGKHKQPFLQLIEAHDRVAEYYKSHKVVKLRNKWLVKLIKLENMGAKKRNEHTRYLAAGASLELARPKIDLYEAIKLNRPLKKNLRIKKQRMKAAINAFKQVLSYKVAQYTTAATYSMGEIYSHLANSLMTAEKPKGLSTEELEQYDILLEEQAYPFEEKSIDIHVSNIKRTQQGIYDEWIKKSMKILASYQPARYAKHEKMKPYVLITQ